MSDTALVVEEDPPRADVLRLLRAAALPTADVGARADQKFFGIRETDDRGTWLGVVGVERYGNEALLRSLAVSPAARKRGLGAKLVAAVELLARARRYRRVVLLTTDAQAYFSRLGYQPVERQTLSKALAASTQLTSLCPTTATVMAKDVPED